MPPIASVSAAEVATPPGGDGRGHGPLATPERADAGKSRKLSYKEKIELEKLPALIEKTEADIAALEARMADPAFFTQAREATEKALKDLAGLQAALATHYARWEELDALPK